MLRTLLASLATGATLLALPALASASPGTSATFAAAPSRHLTVTVQVNRFRATAAGTKADGTATATLTGLGQVPTTVRKKVTLTASKSGSCTILTLTLDTLDLKLLGLDVHLDKVDLSLTGQRRGGVLGSLFCSLANAKVKAARVAAVHRINTAIRRTGTVRPLRFTVGLQAVSAAAAPTCNVLDLVLGPLHLDLLGLVVDLNQVHLTITADPNGGVLGRLFCGLANTTI
jgi:hypothetical protein